MLTVCLLATRVSAIGEGCADLGGGVEHIGKVLVAVELRVEGEEERHGAGHDKLMGGAVRARRGGHLALECRAAALWIIACEDRSQSPCAPRPHVPVPNFSSTRHMPRLRIGVEMDQASRAHAQIDSYSAQPMVTACDVAETRSSLIVWPHRSKAQIYASPHLPRHHCHRMRYFSVSLAEQCAPEKVYVSSKSWSRGFSALGAHVSVPRNTSSLHTTSLFSR